jgi:hypothetical protein
MPHALDNLLVGIERVRSLLDGGQAAAERLREALRGAPADRMSALDTLVRSFITAEVEATKADSAAGPRLVLLKARWTDAYNRFRAGEGKPIRGRRKP